jgi:hypothetical protein
MNLTRTWFTGILLGGVAVWVMCDNVWAQVWQEAPPADNGAAPVEWQQRVLKRPQQPLQWQAPQRSANSYGQAAGQQATGQANPYQTARRSSYDRNAFNMASMPKEPAVVAGRQRATLASDEEVVDPGQMQFQPVASDGVFAGTGGCAQCGGAGGCDQCDAPACGDACDFGWEVFDGRCGPWLRGLSIFTGVDGFKGPLDRGTNGNFGLNEGLNLARPLGDPWGCGYQIGANFVQSDFSGAPLIQNTELRAAYRKQYFATAGIFRRADACGGFQWGIAYDYLHDIFYQNADLQQIRSETGYVIDDTYEIGYYGAYGVGGDQAWNGRQIDGKLDPTDMFVFYVRRNFENGGDGRLWFGATGNGDGLLGVDLWVPLGKSFALENRINYMIPKGGQDTAQPRESWGLVIQLVWYPGQNARCQQQNPYRPMFNVADNSLFMVDRLSHQ